MTHRTINPWRRTWAWIFRKTADRLDPRTVVDDPVLGQRLQPWDTPSWDGSSYKHTHA